jgi:L-threonylcarbamoyladenylate synthase
MPKIIQINKFESEDWLKTTANVLDSSGVIGFPTDTFYGLGANPFDPAAIDKIFTIKSRDNSKPILVLIGEGDQLSQIVEKVSKEADILIKAFWPGPLTLLFAAKSGLPSNLLGNGNTIGVRFPNSKIASQLMRKTGKPITATSANVSGSMECRSGSELFDVLGDKLDLILDGGNAPGGKASTIVDTSCFPPKLIRDGEIERKKIESILNISLE